MYVIVLDFGFPKLKEPDTAWSSIEDLADCTINNFKPKQKELAILAQTESFKALTQRHVYLPGQLQLIPVGQSATNGTTEGGSYHVLACAKDMIEQYEFVKIAICGTNYQPPDIYVVAHQLHLPRVIQQGKIFSMKLIPASSLPTALYPHAAQWWCRNKLLWNVREALGKPLLKWKRQI